MTGDDNELVHHSTALSKAFSDTLCPAAGAQKVRQFPFSPQNGLRLGDVGLRISNPVLIQNRLRFIRKWRLLLERMS